ncbi:MAG: acyltransferase family protein [Lachnospiraceae bacterium]|nr:acyltransferase family protein [Lachnospiraceae bacterium]
MKERRAELDMIRIIVCFLVVLLHVASYGMEAKNPATADWLIRDAVVSLARCAAPLFFMLSGVLFMEKELSIGQLFRKYIAQIALAWLLWSAFYAAIDVIAYLGSGDDPAGYFLTKLLSGHYHLWFLPSLLVAYLFSPLLQKLMSSCTAQELKYLAFVILVGVIGKSTLDPFLGGNAAWDGFWDNFAIPFACIGLLYFVLGYFLYRYRECISAGKAFLLYFLFALVMIAINTVCAFRSGAHSTAGNGYLTLWVVLSSAGMFMFLLQILSEWNPGEKTAARLQSLSSHTFGIYLVHTLFIKQVFRRLGLTQDRFPALVSIVLFSVLTFVLSYVVVWVIKKIPVLGRWVV